MTKSPHHSGADADEALHQASTQSQNLADLSHGLSSASLHEAAGRTGALPSSIKGLANHFTLAGRAFPVACRGGDNLYLHHAIYAAERGDVLVVNAGSGGDFGHWGDVMTAAAQLRGIAGLVISGGVRDSQQMVAMKFPVFAGGICIRGTAKDPHGPGSLGEPVTIGEVTIHRGDFVYGDADGVVVLPQASAGSTIAKARVRDSEEDSILSRLRSGETTLSIYGLPELDPAAPVVSGPRRSVVVPSLGHGNLPIPTAARVGSMVATGGIRGIDRLTGLLPADAQSQAEQMFSNLQAAIEAIGATLDHVVKVTIWITLADTRSVLNAPWQAMFPLPDSRPARHVLTTELPGGMLVQCEALAYVL